MKTSTKLKAGCGILAVFIGGFVLGVIALLVLMGSVIPLAEGWKSEKSKEFVANHFNKKLKLTTEQDKEFRPLVYEALERRWELRRDYLVLSGGVMEERYLERAKTILTDEQFEKAQGMLAKWKRDQERFMLDSWEESESAIVEGEKSEWPTAEGEQRVEDKLPPK